jgi:hypothetical protein
MFPEKSPRNIRAAIANEGLTKCRPSKETPRHPAIMQIRQRCWDKGVKLAALSRELGLRVPLGTAPSKASLTGILKAVERLGGKVSIVCYEQKP